MKSGIWLTDKSVRRYPNANEEEFRGKKKVEYFYNPRGFIIFVEIWRNTKNVKFIPKVKV